MYEHYAWPADGPTPEDYAGGGTSFLGPDGQRLSFIEVQADPELSAAWDQYVAETQPIQDAVNELYSSRRNTDAAIDVEVEDLGTASGN